MTNAAEAWLVECGNVRVFVSTINMLHVIEDATLRHRVPMTPVHCNSVLVWQQRVIPVVNLAILLNHSSRLSCHCSCVLGWHDVEAGTEYGVLAASAFPQRVMIHDSHSVTAPAQLAEVWQGYALCFVEYNNKVIPIIDPARLFGSSQFNDGNQKSSIGMIA